MTLLVPENNPLDKHSPFPWYVRATCTDYPDTVYIIQNEPEHEAGYRDPESQANARIIAASGDLIQALRHVHAHLVLGMSTREAVIEHVEEAYKKAMGRGFSTPCLEERVDP